MTTQGKLLIAAVLMIVGAGVGAYIILGGNQSEISQEEMLETPEFEEQLPLDESEQEEQMLGEESTSEGQPAALVIVDYTNFGFAVASISETAGTTIRFRNQSPFSLEVSSDPHPIHTNCPGYNLGVVPSGGTAEVNLSSGTCGIHNHLNPVHTMTLIGN